MYRFSCTNRRETRSPIAERQPFPFRCVASTPSSLRVPCTTNPRPPHRWQVDDTASVKPAGFPNRSVQCSFEDTEQLALRSLGERFNRDAASFRPACQGHRRHIGQGFRFRAPAFQPQPAGRYLPLHRVSVPNPVYACNRRQVGGSRVRRHRYHHPQQPRQKVVSTTNRLDIMLSFYIL